MTIPHVSEGERITAEWANKLTDAANAGLSPKLSGGQLQATDTGVAFVTHPTLTVALFEIVDDWTYPDSGTDDPTPFTENAKRMILTRGSTGADEDNVYQHTVSSQVLFDTQTIYHPTAMRDDDDIGIGIQPAAIGQRAYAQFSNETSRWELLSPPLTTWRFELKTALTPGGSATAYLLPWTGAAYAEDTDIEFDVYDSLARFRGRALDGGTAGSQGYAKYMPDRGVWEVQSIQPHALMVRCLTDESVATSDASFDVDTVTVMQPTGGLLMADVTLVYNIFDWDIDENAVVVAVWNETTDHWEAIQVECPA